MNETKVPLSEETQGVSCRCPFCDQSMEMPFPFCQACGAHLSYCSACGQALPQDTDTCPHCTEEA